MRRLEDVEEDLVLSKGLLSMSLSSMDPLKTSPAMGYIALELVCQHWACICALNSGLIG